MLLATCLGTAYPAETDSTALAEEDILAFLDDPNALPQILEEPGQDQPKAGIEAQPAYLFSTSARAGIGHSNNFLKKYRDEVKSEYLQLEMDAYANWGTDTRGITAMAFAEATLYDFELEPSDEIMTFAQVGGNLVLDPFDLGFETSLLYGSFIYDASLTSVSVPSGTQIRQLMPSVKLFADWYASGSDRIRLSGTAARSTFNLENQDYWDPAINLELKHVWSRAFLTTTQLDLSRQIYDDDVARNPAGDPLPGAAGLVVTRIALNQRLEVKPESLKWLKMDVSFGIAWEDEDDGQYEAMRQSWIRGRVAISNYLGRFQCSGTWGEYRYDGRVVSSTDDTLNLQTNRSLTVEYKRSLPWNTRLILRNQWNSLSSRIYQDSYSERRSEILLEWIY